MDASEKLRTHHLINDLFTAKSHNNLKVLRGITILRVLPFVGLERDVICRAPVPQKKLSIEGHEMTCPLSSSHLTSLPRFTHFISDMMNLISNSEASPSDDGPQGGQRTSFRPHAKFSVADDDQLRSLVATLGTNNWTRIAERIGDKNARQCKDRWFNYLCPELNTACWSGEEDMLLQQKFLEFGNKWVRIAQFFPNRTGAMVKNRLNTLQRRDRKRQELILRCDCLFYGSLFRVQTVPVPVAESPPEADTCAIPPRTDYEPPKFEPEVLRCDFWGDAIVFAATEPLDVMRPGL
jgi:hypothetical protein